MKSEIVFSKDKPLDRLIKNKRGDTTKDPTES